MLRSLVAVQAQGLLGSFVRAVSFFMNWLRGTYARYLHSKLLLQQGYCCLLC